MRAAVYRGRGPAAEVLEVVDLRDPEPGPGEVRVRLRVSGVNPTDWKARAGAGALDRPFQVPGQDGAGDVEQVGPGVDPGRVGERVWVYHAAWQRAYGTAAQYTVVPEAQAVRLPDTVSYEQGAGLGIPGITAHRCVFADGPVDGRTVLVTGGAGAVGHAATALACWGGAHVVATVSSPEKAAIAARAGAAATVDYRTPGAVDRLRAVVPDGVHRVVDVALGANLELDLAVLRPHGSIVTYASEATDPVLPTRRLMTANQRVEYVLVYTLTPSQVAHAVADLTSALDDGALPPLPEHRFPLDAIAAAHDAVEAGAVGKVLVENPLVGRTHMEVTPVPQPTTDEVRVTVAGLMPGLLDDLRALVRIPSVAFPGFPPEPVQQMADAVVDLFRRSGASDARLFDIPDGYPAVYAEVPGPPGSPTVLLYAHYDVQPAPPEQGWDTDPWTPVDGPDGRIYGRGAADDKSGLVIHAGTLRALAGRMPVTLRVLVEGEEETISHLEAFVEQRPDLFACDAFVIADMGNPEVGVPALTTALRGDVVCTVTVRALEHEVHSGVFGGAAPDALLALVRILATLHDDAGDTVVPGLFWSTWSGADVDEASFRDSAGVLDGARLVGTGSLASRLWARPSVTVLGIDAPTVAEAANVLIPEATAKISLRVAPGADAGDQLDKLMAHLRSVAPWGVQVDVRPVKTGRPFQVDEAHPVVAAARDALAESYGRPAGTIGSGGSIPLLEALRAASPDAGMVLWGAEDTARARIHASNESVDPSEVERVLVAQVLMLARLGTR